MPFYFLKHNIMQDKGKAINCLTINNKVENYMTLFVIDRTTDFL